MTLYLANTVNCTNVVSDVAFGNCRAQTPREAAIIFVKAMADRYMTIPYDHVRITPMDDNPINSDGLVRAKLEESQVFSKEELE